jgi:hypothetical protein
VTGGRSDQGQNYLDKVPGDKGIPGTKCRVLAAATVTNSKRKAKTKGRRKGTGKLVVMHSRRELREEEEGGRIFSRFSAKGVARCKH